MYFPSQQPLPMCPLERLCLISEAAAECIEAVWREDGGPARVPAGATWARMLAHVCYEYKEEMLRYDDFAGDP